MTSTTPAPKTGPVADLLRLNVGVPATPLASASRLGVIGGDAAGFPNGRRLQDDVIDTILFFVANQNTLGDNVSANDVAFRNSFPFLAAPQQPRASGDDNTKN